MTSAKKRQKVIRSQRGGVSLVVDEAIGVMDIADLDGHALVGKFYRRRVNLAFYVGLGTRKLGSCGGLRLSHSFCVPGLVWLCLLAGGFAEY